MSASAGRILLIFKGTYDGTVTYSKLDAVYYNGSSYVCKQTSLNNLPTNTTYWQVLCLGSGSANGPLDLADVAPIETSSTASQAYTVGDWMIYGSNLHIVTANIAQGGTIVVNTNIAPKTLKEFADGKADKVANATSGNIASLDANGNLTDSGKTLGKSVPPDAVFTDTVTSLDSVSDKYDPITTYSAGDYFIKDDVLYKVKTSCINITPPNPTYYEVVDNVAKKLKSLDQSIESLNSQLAKESVTGQITKNTNIYINEILDQIYSTVDLSKITAESKLIFYPNDVITDIYTCYNQYKKFAKFWYYGTAIYARGIDIENKKYYQWSIDTSITKTDNSTDVFMSPGTFKWKLIY